MSSEHLRWELVSEKKLVDTSALSGHQAMADKMRELEVGKEL